MTSLSYSSMTGKNKGFDERLQQKANETCEHKWDTLHYTSISKSVMYKSHYIAHVIKYVKNDQFYKI